MSRSQSLPPRDRLGMPLRLEEDSEDALSEDESSDDETTKIDSLEHFAALGFPMPSSTPTFTEAQSEALDRSAHVLASWRELQQILERHEEMIRKRWAKKTKSQRTTIILGAWPQMSALHRPDFEALRREPSGPKNGGTKFREAYLWPYMNVEDLVKGKTMLLFLNSRGRHPPYMFAHADFEAAHLGHISQKVMPAFLNLHTMILDGTEVSTYGRIVAWRDDENAFTNNFNGIDHQPGSGLWILEIQERVLKFLVDCCRALLHDFDKSSLISGATIKLEPLPIKDSSEYSSIAAIAAEAPYRLPAHLDLNRLKGIIAAKRLDAEDHIRSLREDPGYFAEVVGDWAEHRQENFLDTNGARHPVLNTPLFWERVISNMLIHAYGSLAYWTNINSELANVSAMHEKYSDVISIKKELPLEYMKALLSFRYVLDQVMKGPIALLKTGFCVSPPIRPYFIRLPNVPGSTMIKVQSKPRMAGYKEIYPLFWLLQTLWTENQLWLVGADGLMDEIEYLVKKEPKEKARISPWIARVLSELGLLARIKHELQLFQPWASGYEYYWKRDLLNEIQDEFADKFRAFATIDHVFKDDSLGRKLSTFGVLTGRRFYYPSDKKRTKQTTDDMRKAELNLDLFWHAVDAHFEQQIGRSLDDIAERPSNEIRTLERTSEWIEPTKGSIEAASIEGESKLCQLQSSLHLGTSTDPPKFIPWQPKIKTKTRKSPQAEPQITEETIVPQPDEGTIFRLKGRAFKVFQTLFFNPYNADLPGEISWSDFLYAMTSTGFSPEKLYGSVWQFTPSGLDVERSIQFHEPHPVGKIPFRRARRIGRRLARAYGWTGGMFVLE